MGGRVGRKGGLDRAASSYWKECGMRNERQDSRPPPPPLPVFGPLIRSREPVNAKKRDDYDGVWYVGWCDTYVEVCS